MLNEIHPPPLEPDADIEEVAEESAPPSVVAPIRTIVVPHTVAPRGGYSGAHHDTLSDASLRRDPTPDIRTYDTPTVMREAPSDIWLSIVVIGVVVSLLVTILVIFL